MIVFSLQAGIDWVHFKSKGNFLIPEALCISLFAVDHLRDLLSFLINIWPYLGISPSQRAWPNSFLILMTHKSRWTRKCVFRTDKGRSSRPLIPQSRFPHQCLSWLHKNKRQTLPSRLSALVETILLSNDYTWAVWCYKRSARLKFSLKLEYLVRKTHEHNINFSQAKPRHQIQRAQQPISRVEWDSAKHQQCEK